MAAAVAYRRAGATLPVSILIGLSAITVVHAPPVGPVGLAIFALAVALAARGERAPAEASTPPPPPAVATPV